MSYLNSGDSYPWPFDEVMGQNLEEFEEESDEDGADDEAWWDLFTLDPDHETEDWDA